jgi:hypothetical protein
LQNAEQQVVSNLHTSNKVVVLGDMVMQINDIVPESNLFKFQICSSKLSSGYASVYMNIQLPKGYDVQKFVYTLNTNPKFQLQAQAQVKYSITDCYFNASRNGNVLTLRDMFNNLLPYSTQATSISGTIAFKNGQKYTFAVNDFNLTEAFSGKLEKSAANTTDVDYVFKPNTFGYRRLGIADYQKVVSKICRYEAGEVAHIENVMARELREKSTKRFQQRQVVEIDSQEIETEKLTDVSSAERFEMQTEISKLVQEDRQFSANAGVSVNAGFISVDVGASYA